MAYLILAPMLAKPAQPDNPSGARLDADPAARHTVRTSGV